MSKPDDRAPDPTAAAEEGKAAKFARSARRAFAALLALVVVVLVFQNTDVVAVHLLFWRFEMSLALLVLLVAGISAIAAVLATLWRTSVRSPGPR